MWIELAPGSFLNLDRVGGVRFARGDGGALTAAVETVGGRGRRYEGGKALKPREAGAALCVPATAEK
jgi:hypothetical protein